MDRLKIISRHLNAPEDICIIATSRSPIKPAFGEFKNLSSVELAGQTIKGLLTRFSIDKNKIEELYLGTVYSSNVGQSPAKQAAVIAGLPDSVSCMSNNKLCASAMKAFMLGCMSLQSKNAECVLVGGTESMSNYPYLLNLRNGVHLQAKDSLNWDVLPDAITKEFPVKIADALSREMQFSKDQLDQYAVNSCNRTKSAFQANKFQNEIVSILNPKNNKIITTDTFKEGKAIPKLKPLLKDGTTTAGNACGINDGASFIILSTRSKAIKEGWKVLATVVSYADAEQHSRKFPVTPALAIEKALKIANLDKKSIDFIELNEPFSLVVLGNAKLLNYPVEKINVYGGALSLGHPVGSSGCKIIGTLVNVLRQEKGKYGVASICNGAGGASAVVIKAEVE